MISGIAEKEEEEEDEAKAAGPSGTSREEVLSLLRPSDPGPRSHAVR